MKGCEDYFLIVLATYMHMLCMAAANKPKSEKSYSDVKCLAKTILCQFNQSKVAIELLKFKLAREGLTRLHVTFVNNTG